MVFHSMANTNTADVAANGYDRSVRFLAQHAQRDETLSVFLLFSIE